MTTQTQQPTVPLVPLCLNQSLQQSTEENASLGTRRSLRKQTIKIKPEEIVFLFETSDKQDTSDEEDSRRRRRVLSTSSDASESKFFDDVMPSSTLKSKTSTSDAKDYKKKKLKKSSNVTSKKKQASNKTTVKSKARNKKRTQIKKELDSDSDAENEDDIVDFSSSSDEDETIKRKRPSKPAVKINDENKSLTAIEAQRQKNIEERMKLFQDLKINEAKEELEHSLKRKQQQRPPKVSISGPRRKSMRLEGMEAVNYEDNDKLAITKSSFQYFPSMSSYAREWGDEPRKVESVLPMSEVILQKLTTEDYNQVLSNCCARIQEEDKKISGESFFEKLPIKAFKSTFETLKIKNHHKVKVTPSRIYSMSFHPKYNGVLLAAGCKSGAVGIWNANLKNDDSDDPQIITFNHHVKPTSCVSFSKSESQILYSTSYDGTVRRGDLHQQTFTLVYFTPEDGKTQHVAWHNEISPGVLLIGQGDGNIIKVDVREPDSKSVSYKCHDRSVRTIDAHPTKEHHFVTTSSTRVASIWDLRKMKKNNSNSAQLGTVSFKKALSGAFFSPITGDKLLTTSYDDNISVFSCSDLATPILTSKVNHNTNTGRWITNFKAMWHPQREDIFIVGSMDRPRKLQIYEAAQNKCGVLCNMKDNENFTTIGAVAMFHPTLPSIACGNASGYIHLFV